MAIESVTGPDPEPSRPRTGGYYWLPVPLLDGVSWGLITCHDLGRGSGVGHVRLWPEVLRRLASAWRKTPEEMIRHIGEHYTGLPRGRVTRVRGGFLLLHGDDTPMPDGLEVVRNRFALNGHPLRFLFDEHERMLAGDPEALQHALGVDLGLSGN